ncbi:MAG: hypothetical protein DRN15_03995 [Thermoprotei archaeon]|nr:MAG: hypothetical protein DRM97_06065 [Thermoprotei archaeon]RLF24065.1 MAG: hypothetical protein DRN15_03995 [Thermoprotei archaeon]
MKSNSAINALLRPKINLVSLMVVITTWALLALSLCLPWYVVRSINGLYLLFPWGYAKVRRLSVFPLLNGNIVEMAFILDSLSAKVLLSTISIIVSTMARIASKSESKMAKLLIALTLGSSGILLLASAIAFQYEVILRYYFISSSVDLYYGLVLAYALAIALLLQALKIPENMIIYELVPIEEVARSDIVRPKLMTYLKAVATALVIIYNILYRILSPGVPIHDRAHDWTKT